MMMFPEAGPTLINSEEREGRSSSQGGTMLGEGGRLLLAALGSPRCTELLAVFGKRCDSRLAGEGLGREGFSPSSILGRAKRE